MLGKCSSSKAIRPLANLHNGKPQLYVRHSGAIRQPLAHDTLQRRRRHRNVELLQADYFKERDFASWTMAFAGSPGEADIKMASTHRPRDVALGDGASGVINLLRWLLDEQRVTLAIR